MGLQKLTCQTLAELDEGAAGIAINRAIDEAMVDIEDRGNEDEATRKVVIEIDMTMKKDQLMIGPVKAQAKLPPRQTRITVGAVRIEGTGGKRQPAAIFRNDNATNPNQPTFDYGSGEDPKTAPPE